MLVIVVRDKPMKMAKKVDGFLAILWPKYRVRGGGGGGGDFKGGVPPLMGVGRERSLLAAHAICGFGDPAHAIWWVAEAFPLL